MELELELRSAQARTGGRFDKTRDTKQKNNELRAIINNTRQKQIGKKLEKQLEKQLEQDFRRTEILRDDIRHFWAAR